jgi:hypothetical protein
MSKLTLIMAFIATLVFISHTSVFGQLKSKKYDEKSNLIYWPSEFNPKVSKFYVYNEININASPETVWNILIDAKKWHTYYRGTQSPIEFLDTNILYLQNEVTFKFHTMGLKFQPIINEFIPNQKLSWTSRIKSIQGYHAWVIVPTSNGCKLITAESQNGFLTFMQKVFQPNKLLNLHEHWLEVIKARAEQTTPK